MARKNEKTETKTASPELNAEVSKTEEAAETNTKKTSSSRKSGSGKKDETKSENVKEVVSSNG